MSKPLRVLIVEDSEDDAQLILLELKRGGFEPNFERVDTPESMKTALDRQGWDIILADYVMPRFSGLEALKIVKEKGLELPFIVISGKIGEDVAIAAMKAGAQDYILKNSLKRLAVAVRRELEEAKIRKERKQAEEALRVSETRYRRLFETAKDGILILDAEAGTIVDVNPFLIEMLGFSHEQFLGKTIWEIGVFKDVASNKASFMELQRQGYVRYEDLPLETAERQRIEVEVVSNVYEVNNQNVIQCNFRDITERKRFEAVKDDFVSMVSHELRTPLTSIREAVSQTLDGILGEVTEQQREILSMALSDIDRLTRLINDLLDISKIDAVKMKMKIEVCEIVDLVKKLISSFIPQAKAKGLEMEGSFSKEKIRAYVDKDRITQVFSNLIGNAVKFTQKGRIQVSLLDREDAIECSVSDTGPGIAKKDFAQLFDKFQQFGHQVNGEEKGTGLGLAVSKGIVELHKGRIWVESQVNAGTKFTFVLPKFTGKELISEGLKKAIKEGQPLSVLIFNIKNPGTIQKKMGEEKVGLLINDFWKLIKENLRRDEDDLGIEDLHTILTILPGTEKESAAAVLERMNDLLRGYLLREKIEEEVDLVFEIIAYPEDGKTEEELLSRLENILANKAEAEVSSK